MGRPDDGDQGGADENLMDWFHIEWGMCIANAFTERAGTLGLRPQPSQPTKPTQHLFEFGIR
jgi:hypothetical protein